MIFLFLKYLHNLNLVLKRCRDTNLVLNWEKCQFMVYECIIIPKRNRGESYQGGSHYKVTHSFVLVKVIRSFLGHKVCQRLLQNCQTMIDLLAKDIEKTHQCTCGSSPYWTSPFELTCDTNDTVVGVVLGQRKDKVFHTIYYASRTLNEVQYNYTTTEKKLSTIVVDHLSSLDQSVMQHIGDGEIKETFSDKCLLVITLSSLAPYIINYITNQVFLPNFTPQENKKLWSDVKHYLWDDLYLFKVCEDNMVRRCILIEEAYSILTHCHSMEVRGHFGPTQIAYKGIDFMGLFPKLFTNEYILVGVDYVSKWVKVIALPTNDA
ncbi:hypothetical protein CR513_59381, partial [Mucuna pruriens]